MRKRSSYRLSKRAKADLKSLWLYGLQTWSLAQAESYVAGLYQKFEFLTEWPSTGRKGVGIPDGYLRFEYQSHTIFYKVEKSGVAIIRVLHERMDAGRHL